MTSTAMLARLRALSDEANAGFWTDVNLYLYLDSAQNIIIDLLLAKQRAGKNAQGKYYEIEELKTLIKPCSAITLSTASNTISLSSITDMIEIYQSTLYNYEDGTPVIILNYVPLNELKLRLLNSYTGHSWDTTSKSGQIYCSLYQGNLLTSFPINQLPYAYLNRAVIYYYAQPATVGASQNFTLPSNTHEAGLYFALSQAYTQDARPQEAEVYYNKALQLIGNL